MKETREERSARVSVVAHCKQYGVSEKIANRIFSEWGLMAMKRLVDDPFDIIEIPFCTIKHAEKLAINIPHDDIRRLKAYCNVSLNDVLGDAIEYQNNSGDTYVKFEQLKKAFSKRFGKYDFNECLEASNAIVDDMDDLKIVSSALLVNSEMTIAEKLIRSMEIDEFGNVGGLHGAVIEKLEGLHFSDEQKNAIANSIACAFSVVTGGAGTGKTETIKGIIDINKSVMVVAPTGKAAKRASKLTNHDAYTIHLAILSPKISKELAHVNVVVVDEASMMDTVIFARLIEFLEFNNPECRIVLAGDENQLKSVQAGAVLRDIIASSTVPVQKLTKNFRQGAGSIIAQNAAKVWDGDTNLIEIDGQFEIKKVADMVDTWIWLKENPTPYPIISAENNRFGWGVNPLNFMMQEWHNPCPKNSNDCTETIYNHHKNSGEVVYLLEDIPKRGMYAGDVGKISNAKNNGKIILEINNSQITLTRADFERKVRHQKVFRPNDPIMHLVNNREIGLVNGDIGRVLTVSLNTMTADFEGKMITFKRNKQKLIDDLTLARVFTCHKCQGDEYPEVVILLSKSFYREALNRDWLGTAITRAKGKVTIIHDGCLNQVIKRQARPRKTQLLNFVEKIS